MLHFVFNKYCKFCQFLFREIISGQYFIWLKKWKLPLFETQTLENKTYFCYSSRDPIFQNSFLIPSQDLIWKSHDHYLKPKKVKERKIPHTKCLVNCFQVWDVASGPQTLRNHSCFIFHCFIHARFSKSQRKLQLACIIWKPVDRNEQWSFKCIIF